MPTLTVSPTTSILGSKVRVTGSNFAPRITVNLYFDRAQVSKFKATAGGGFYTDVTLPLNAGAGTHIIKAITKSGETSTSVTAMAVPTPEPEPTPTHPADTIWVDDFNGTSIDTTKWRVMNAGGPRACCGSVGANQADAVEVGGGYLHLYAKLVNGVWHRGCIDTETKKLFGFGIWEARIKCPKGKGMWPAFWGYDGSGEEIDVLEGGGTADKAMQGIHRVNNDTRTARDTVMSLSDDFHIYSVEYRSTGIQFSIDGVKRGTLITPSLSKSMPLILNLGVGNASWSAIGMPDSTTPTINEMLVDWVRVRA